MTRIFSFILTATVAVLATQDAVLAITDDVLDQRRSDGIAPLVTGDRQAPTTERHPRHITPRKTDLGVCATEQVQFTSGRRNRSGRIMRCPARVYYVQN